MSCPPRAPDPASPRRSPLTFPIAAVLAMVAALGISSLPHSNRWWGVDVLHFHSAAFRLAWTAAAIAATGIAWWVGAPDRRLVPRLPAPIGTHGKAGGSREAATRVLAAFLVAIVSGILFHVFRSRSGLVGRGTSILIDLRQGTPPVPESPVYTFLETGLTRWLRGMRSTPSLEEAGRLSLLAGAAAFGLAAWILIRRARRRGAASTAGVAAIVLLQPATALFYGQVGAWALPGAAALLFLLLSQTTLEESGSLLAPGLALAVVLVTHPLGLAFLPAFVLLAFLRSRGKRLAIGDAVAAAAVLAMAAISASLFRAAAPGFRAGPPAVLDTVNTLWFLGAPAIVILVAAVLPGRTRRDIPWSRLAPAVSVLLVFVAARLVIRTDQGFSRSWDLLSPIGFALAAMAAVAAGGRPPGETGHTAASPGIGPVQAAVLGLFFLVPWIALESNGERAVARHLEIADAAPALEPRVAADFHATMGDRLLHNGNTRLAARAYEEAFTRWPDPRYSWRSGLCYESAGLLEQAGAAFRETTRRNPLDWQAWSELGNVLCGLNLFDRAQEALRHAIQLNPWAAAPRVHLARTLAYLGRSTEAREMLETARPLIRPHEPVEDSFRLLDGQLPRVLPGPAPVPHGGRTTAGVPGNR